LFNPVTVDTRFLLGPAGSGKTFRCLAEIRRELIASPDGPPLLLLAPKQATFQLERQLLADPDLHGYTRLQILSFDRLAQFILGETAAAPPNWLDDEGRVMVLRALLNQKRADLKLFHATARLPGFATRLSLLLRELQRHQISPRQLSALAQKISQPAQLRAKLHDFALLLGAYLDWLQTHDLKDLDSVQDEAAADLRAVAHSATPGAQLQLAGVWMDGFAELTAQELDLLAAVIPLAKRTTLAFCLPGEIKEEPSWLSPWSVIGQTFLRCRERIARLPAAEVSVETLPTPNQPTRFSANPGLAHLESSWANKSPTAPSAILNSPSSSLRWCSCANPEAEATLAAREIRRFVRTGGRYREAAVLVRSLDGYADTLRRVFARYDIPIFLDRRESVAHHPLAELTRYALRTVAFSWRRADWFGALKTGLVPANERDIDWLENSALENGWEGSQWQKPLSVPNDTASSDQAERLRQKLVPPFLALAQQITAPLSGAQLATTLRSFWETLHVEKTIAHWNDAAAQANAGNQRSAIHETVASQLANWLDNLARAFPTEALPLREWLPILESGLANLTIGVIPPTLDQVLVGAIDRSRNPDLKLAFVLGLNEGVFPKPPKEDPLLNELERDTLQLHGAKLGATVRHRLGHEWFYGYIACTRASERLILTSAQTDARGTKLNRSPFFDHLKKIFPTLEAESWQPPTAFTAVEHLNEIIAPAIRLDRERSPLAARETSEASPNLPTPLPHSAAADGDRPRSDASSPTPQITESVPNPSKLPVRTASPSLAPSDGERAGVRGLLSLPQLTPALTKARQLTAAAHDQLSPPAAAQLHGPELATSVSALENFAACPFKFFISHGLRAAERKEYELDARERGSFQHEVLTVFHNEVRSENLNWRDLTPDQARTRIRRISENLLTQYRQGLLVSDAARRFAGRHLLDSLETLIGVLIGWARDYQFDPTLVETGFGLGSNSPWPAWRLELDSGHALLLRGRVDRVDVWRDPTTGAALAVVMDYKSSSRKPDDLKLHHGLQLQLPAYLAALEQLPEVRATLNATSLAPAGVFYVNLRGEFASEKNRSDALAEPTLALRQGFQHAGRFDETCYDKLDPRGSKEQFKTHHASRNTMEAGAFRDLLNRAVANLRRFGNEIYSGTIAPAPFRKGTETACDFCDYAAICRFDPWTQSFRALSKLEKAKV
jgi:ATP-dependent helicase/nuclease subunit B